MKKMTTTSSRTTTVMHIRGSNPSIQSGSSNLVFVLGTNACDSISDMGVITLKNNTTFRDQDGTILRSESTPFLSFNQRLNGVDICADGVGIGMGSLAPDGVMRFCSRPNGDGERARIDSYGLTCSTFSAATYMGLCDRFDIIDGFRPVSATALADAYVSLSNMISSAPSSSAMPVDGFGVPLLDTFGSTSTTNAPTANALRMAYSTLSNSMNAQLYLMSNAMQNMVYDAVVATMLSTTGTVTGDPTTPAEAAGTGELSLMNGMDIMSFPDNQARLRFESGSETVFKSSGNRNAIGEDVYAFRWMVNDVQETRMTLSGNGNLWVGGSLSLGDGGDFSVSSNLNLGHVTLKSFGSNLGVNLPLGIEPQYGLHVNGVIYSDDGVYALSDMSLKDDVKPIDRALSRLMQLRGYTYDLKGRRRMGMSAHELLDHAPEAVSVDNRGLLSVAYGDVLALVVEAVRELGAALTYTNE